MATHKGKYFWFLGELKKTWKFSLKKKTFTVRKINSINLIHICEMQFFTERFMLKKWLGRHLVAPHLKVTSWGPVKTSLKEAIVTLKKRKPSLSGTEHLANTTNRSLYSIHLQSFFLLLCLQGNSSSKATLLAVWILPRFGAFQSTHQRLILDPSSFSKKVKIYVKSKNR